MKYPQSLARNFLSPASPHGQGIVAAPQAYFAKQSMERVRHGTAKSIAYTGSSGVKNGICCEDVFINASHLHVYLSPKDVTDFLDLIITGEGENQIIYATKKKDTFVVNPFDYSEKRFLEK